MVLLPKFSHQIPTLNIAIVIWLVDFKVLIHILFDHSSPSFTMRPLSPATCDHIITVLHSGVSRHSIHHATGVSLGVISKIHSKYCFETPKSLGGHPTKLTPANISYAKCLIFKADNTVQVTKSLEDITNMSISTQTFRHTLCEAGVRCGCARSTSHLGLSRHLPFVDTSHMIYHIGWPPPSWGFPPIQGLYCTISTISSQMCNMRLWTELN